MDGLSLFLAEAARKGEITRALTAGGIPHELADGLAVLNKHCRIPERAPKQNAFSAPRST
jgi:hypothetical protein